MSKVQTETAKIQIDTTPDITVTDSLGRVLTLKRPNVLSQYRMVEALGPASENGTYLAMCIPLLYVAAVDGDVIRQPTSKMQVEALVQRLDEAGLVAIQQGIEKHFSPKDEAAQAKK